eukprot:8076616-Pyramimonas_sp.AAC.1
MEPLGQILVKGKGKLEAFLVHTAANMCLPASPVRTILRSRFASNDSNKSFLSSRSFRSSRSSGEILDQSDEGRGYIPTGRTNQMRGE